MNNPKVSIITVVYNGEKYIEQTIKSVISQSYSNIEYIIIDGDSKDKTKDIINSYISRIDVFSSEKDRGLSDAMNKGTGLATGDWILHLHADDTFVDNQSIETLVRSSSYKPNCNWVTGFLVFTDENSKVFREDKFYKHSWYGMLIRNIIRHQATLIKRSCALELPFNEEYKYAMDYDFFLRLWKNYGDPISIKQHIVRFRLDGNNLSSNFVSSLNDEAKARRSFRIANNQRCFLWFDYVIYKLRYYKIHLIHNRK